MFPLKVGTKLQQRYNRGHKSTTDCRGEVNEKTCTAQRPEGKSETKNRDKHRVLRLVCSLQDTFQGCSLDATDV